MSEPTLVQHLLERTNAPTFLVSLPQGEILAANQSACELLQPEASTLGSTRFTEAFEFPEDCPFKAYFEKAPPGSDKACAILFKSDANGRKIVIRKTRAELNCDFECPYSSCDKAYASEGSLNLHIKRKHNGGNKTDREKIAKSLLIFEAKGVRIDKELAVNLPPGIIRKVAEQIETTSNLRIKE